jgi:hypothetical protein
VIAPVAVQLPLLAAAQLSEVLTIAPGLPVRSVTVIVFDCLE